MACAHPLMPSPPLLLLPLLLQIAELAARVSLGDDKLRSKESAYAQLRADNERLSDELTALAKHLSDAQDSLHAMREVKAMDADVKTALAQVRRHLLHATMGGEEGRRGVAGAAAPPACNDGRGGGKKRC